MSYPDFYVTSATVIPVFFLALTLQSTQFEATEQLMQKLNNSIKGYLDQNKTAQDIIKQGYSGLILKFVLPGLAFSVIWAFVSALLVLSVLGEVFAILALYQGKANAGTQPVVLISVLSLAILVGLLFYGRLQRLWGANMVILVRSMVRAVRLIPLLIPMILASIDETPGQRQNEATTSDVERSPDEEETNSHQESSS
jgi:hypothetical protein